MSKPTDRKKSRRQKRLARRAEWDTIVKLAEELADDAALNVAPRNVTDVLLGVCNTPDDDYPADVVEVVSQAQQLERRILQRGWTFDSEFSSTAFASWFFEPSAREFEDEALEQVTRVWITVNWDDVTDPNDFPYCVNVLFVGSGERDISRRPTLDDFFEQIDAIESYRVGDAAPIFDES